MPSSEPEIVSILCRGDQDEEHAALLNNIRLRFVKIARWKQIPSQDIDDVVNDGIVRLLSKCSRYRGDSPFEQWAAVLFINLCLDYLRGARRRDAIEFLNGMGSETEEPTSVNSVAVRHHEPPVDPSPDPEGQLLVAELKRIVREVIVRRKLGERNAQIVRLGLCSQLTPREILEELYQRFPELNPNTIRIVLSRFRRLLCGSPVLHGQVAAR
jgi:RNA polymerase sigma factor (sigma-70 family)